MGFIKALPRFQKISVRDVDAALLVGLGALGFMRTYEGLYGFMRAYEGLWGSEFKDEALGLSVFETLQAQYADRQTNRQAYGQTNRQAGLGFRVLHPSIRPSTHGYIHTFIHSCIHTYIHTYIHTVGVHTHTLT